MRFHRGTNSQKSGSDPAPLLTYVNRRGATAITPIRDPVGHRNTTETTMKKTALALAALLTFAMVAEAFAGCPLPYRYQCYQGANGKVVCSCS